MMTNREEPTIKLHKQRDLHNTRPVYVAADVHGALKQLSKDTQIPIARIIDKMLMHGLQYLEVIDLSDDEGGDK